jgi:hypothetical protein
MLLGLFLTVLLLVVVGAVWSAYQDLKTRDLTPPTPPPAAPMNPEGVWPPPPRL